MKPLVVIIGPTAIGKTSFSIELAKRVHGQIINGDAIQVYRGLDIGSGKITKAQMQHIPHHLLDIRDPDQRFDITQFQSLARSCIDDILAVGDCPIVVGGSGLYIKSLIYDYTFSEDKPLDPMIQAKINAMDDRSLYEWLNQVDPISAQKFHPNNRVRIERCLTIALSNGQTKSSIEARQAHTLLYDVKLIYMDTDRLLLRKRISERVDQMIKDGLLDEIQTLLDQGYTFDDAGLRGIGYKEFKPWFDHKMDCQACIDTVKIHSGQFAKRQRTFFIHQFCQLQQVDPFKDDMDQIMGEIEVWWSTKHAVRY